MHCDVSLNVFWTGPWPLYVCVCVCVCACVCVPCNYVNVWKQNNAGQLFKMCLQKIRKNQLSNTLKALFTETPFQKQPIIFVMQNQAFQKWSVIIMILYLLYMHHGSAIKDWVH